MSIGAIPRDATKFEWVLHHKDPELRHKDPARYAEWRIEDLEPMLKSEHTRLHHAGKVVSEETKAKISQAPKTEEWKRKVSEALKGRTVPEERRKRISESVKLALQDPERKAKMSAAHLGQVPWNKGMCRERPAKDPQKGRIWVNNGERSIKVLPDKIPEGWTLGRIGGWKYSEESKLKMRKAKSEETRRKISEGRKAYFERQKQT